VGIYNFQQRFVPLIMAGRKTHTIRAHREHADKPGNMLHLYTGLRQPNATLLMRVRAQGNDGQCAQPGATNGFWSGAEWIPCRDGKARPVEPGTFPLAYGAAARVGRLRGYGNALVAPQAIEFIKAYMSLCR